jgi:hypothetical protein
MFFFYALLVRIAFGERYERSTPRDTDIWLSFLAAFPFAMGIGYAIIKLAPDRVSFIFLCAFVIVPVFLAATWLTIARYVKRRAIFAIALTGWSSAFAAAIYLNR